ncbi:hypothetical protein SAMN04487969_1514 [Paenibacillus algorifonticola]|uniref:Uncharacterized protein n=1 Tax=Paenibacillus algorifonticola TaxID=684063 RepID=A0A1I2J654_9BACL|nr:hypothetical protein [Paenibacillus algorifonticola]SFF48436.1 hypothetical protein SAMN04487969_1514 [Paenibacillus algorifonticola]
MRGLVAKVKVKKLNEISVLSKEVNTVFDLQKIDDYKRIFNDLVLEKTIVKGSYHEDQWIVKRNTIRQKNAYFNFAQIQDPLQKEILRAFVTIKLTTTEATYVCRMFNKIILFLTKHDLDNSKITTERFKTYLYFESREKPRPQKSIQIIAYAWDSFLIFSNWNERLKELSKIITHAIDTLDISQQSRTLPSYADVLIFNDALTEFKQLCEKEAAENHPVRLLTYYPLFLWWKISNIIPIRPTEFLLLKRDCAQQEGDCFVLEVERIKDKKAISNSLKIENKIPISEELYNDINRYIELSNPYHFSSINQLCSFTTYLQMLQTEDRYSRVSIDYNKVTSIFFNELHLLRLLKLFYEVIYEDYPDLLIKEFNDKGRFVPRTLEKLKLGDTRHFTIYQMRMRGLSALTIARLAGHKDITTQEKYMRHGKWFAQSEIALLEEKMLKTKALISKSGYFDLEKWLEVMDGRVEKSTFHSTQLDSDLTKLPVVGQHGEALIRCLQDPSKCSFEGECTNCPNSYISPEDFNIEIKQFYERRSSYIQDRMLEVIDVLNAMASKMNFNFEKKTEEDPWEISRLKQMAKEIRELQFQQATINAKLKKYERIYRGGKF